MECECKDFRYLRCLCNRISRYECDEKYIICHTVICIDCGAENESKEALDKAIDRIR